MQIKTLLSYGLRFVIFLAINGGVRSSREISSAIGVPRDYLVQIAQILRKGDIIEAFPGKNGGYSLAVPADQITLYEVISLLEEDAKTPEQVEKKVQDFEQQSPMMQEILKAIDTVATSHDAYLDSITIQTIIDSSQNPENIDGYLSEMLASTSARYAERQNISDQISSRQET